MSAQLTGPSRGVWLNAQDGINYIYSGYNNGLQSFGVDNNGVGAGFTNYTLSNFTASDNNLWQFDGFYDVSGSGLQSLVAAPCQNLNDLTNTINTPVLIGDITGSTMSQIGVFTNANAYLNSTTTVTFSATDTLIGAGQTVTGTGIPANTTVVSTTLTSGSLSNTTVTGTSGTFSCSATSGLFIGQTVTPSGSLGNNELSTVAITGTSGTFSCTATTGLYVNQPVAVTGTATSNTFASPAITSSSGTFSCTATTGLAVDQPVYVTGTYGTNALSGVAITGLSGTFSCTATTGLYIGQPFFVTGTVAATTIATVAVTGIAGQCSVTPSITNGGLYIGMPIKVTGTLTGTATGINANTTYFIISTDGVSTFTLSATSGGTAIVTTVGTTTGLTFSATFRTGIASSSVYYIIATNGTSTFTLSDSQNGQAIITAIASVSGLTFTGANGVGLIPGNTYYIIVTNGTSSFTLSSVLGGTAITGTYGSLTGLTLKTVPYSGVTTNTTYYIIATNGTSTFTLSSTLGGSAITTVVTGLSGLTFNAANSIGLTAGTTYYIIATNYSTTFTLSATLGGPALTTIVRSTSGLTFSLGQYFNAILSNAATVTGSYTLTFNNNISVSGGAVSLHPYLFVYGNNGLIQNCSAGNTNDWVSADANATNVATGKIVQGLPVRGGSNAPSGLFWSVDSLIRVSYIGGTGTPAQYWRYDIISSQSSIMSSQCAIEYDGVYYWIGVDRFLLYNGVVKEIPNNMNQNWFFDNLNYDQRQKVWVTKVPRYGEIWWFYPRGDATECTDAIVFNVRENIWYDVGQSTGAYRSAGYFSQVFPYPIQASWVTTESIEVLSAGYQLTSGSYFVYSDTYQSSVDLLQVVSGTGIAVGSTVKGVTSSNLKTLGAITGGSLYTNGTYTNVGLTGGSGFNAKATVVVSGAAVTSVTITARGSNYVVGNVLSATAASIGGTGSGFLVPVSAIYAQGIELSLATTASGAQTLTFSTPPNLINFYQHEIGTDEVNGQEVTAIPSSFETNDLGWIGGGPSQPAPEGMNKWLRVDRIEPDFVQSGEMEIFITGRPFAQSEDVTTGPYVFGENTGKVDMREQRREIRLRFVSNVVGGNYQLGKIIVTAEIGDTRPYGA